MSWFVIGAFVFFVIFWAGLWQLLNWLSDKIESNKNER